MDSHIKKQGGPDPVQKQLRQEKADWNKEVSSLIANLISLKRGMNGRGDPKANLPPSDIKNPLPPQINDYLNNINLNFSSVIQDGTEIINHQKSYSETRKKPKNAELNYNLISEASWWGSRAWAHVKFLFSNLKKEERKTRLRMIADGADLLEEFDALYIYLNDKDIPNGLTKANLIGVKFLKLLSYYQSLAESHDKINNLKQKQQELADGYASAKAENASEEKSTIAPAEPDAAPDDGYADGYADGYNVGLFLNSPNNAIEYLKIIYQNLIESVPMVNSIIANAEEIIKKSIEADQAAQSDDDRARFTAGKRKTLDRLKSAFSKLENFLALISGIISDPSTLNINEVNSLIRSAQNAHYDTLREIEPLTAGLTFKDTTLKGIYNTLISSNIINVKKAFDSYQNFLKKQDELTKIASNALTRWMSRKWMNLFGTSEQRAILDVMENSENTSRSLEDVLDILEDSKSAMGEITNNFNNCVVNLTRLLTSIKELSEIYALESRRKERGKNYYIESIKSSDLTEIQKSINQLKSFLRKDSGSEEESLDESKEESEAKPKHKHKKNKENKEKKD